MSNWDGPFWKVRSHKNKRKGKGPTARRRASKKAIRLRQDKSVYELVDLRDGLKSRLSGVSGRVERHHIRYRSRGGRTTLDNVILLTPDEHRRVHDGLLRLEGNADEIGGVQVWVLETDSGEWQARPNI